jgi:hypothetical protein
MRLENRWGWRACSAPNASRRSCFARGAEYCCRLVEEDGPLDGESLVASHEKSSESPGPVHEGEVIDDPLDLLRVDALSVVLDRGLFHRLPSPHHALL